MSDLTILDICKLVKRFNCCNNRDCPIVNDYKCPQSKFKNFIINFVKKSI